MVELPDEISNDGCRRTRVSAWLLSTDRLRLTPTATPLFSRLSSILRMGGITRRRRRLTVPSLRPTNHLDPTCATTHIPPSIPPKVFFVDRSMHDSPERHSQCVSQDPDLVINQFLAWLHVDPSGARAPAETMLLKSKPHFLRCRELQSQASRHSFERVMADTEPTVSQMCF